MNVKKLSFSVMLILLSGNEIVAQEAVLRFSDSSTKNITIEPHTVIGGVSTNNNDVIYSNFEDIGSVYDCSRMTMTCQQDQTRNILDNDIIIGQDSGVRTVPISFDVSSSFDANKLKDGL